MQILRNIRAATARAGWCGEFAATLGCDPALSGRCSLALHHAGYLETYPGSHGSRRVRMTDAGDIYAKQLGI